jgi:hypothetical protein
VLEKQAQEEKPEAEEAKEEESSEELQEKEASANVSELNEAFAHLAMAKVEAALRAVESSTKKGAGVAKGDLNTISTKLASLIESSDLGNSKLRFEFKKLAGMAEKVHTYFAV